jgi:tRNA U34 2-thiouridine synthase MnmA/TrmU
MKLAEEVRKIAAEIGAKVKKKISQNLCLLLQKH